MACGGRARTAGRGTAITESVGSLSSESSGAMEAATATALCAVESSFAGVFAPPRGDLLLAWMVMQPLCAYAWTTATMRTLSTDPLPPGSMDRGILTQPLGPSRVSAVAHHGTEPYAGGVLPSPVVNSLRASAPLASRTTVAQRLRVQSPPTLPGDGRPLHQRHAVSLAWTHRMPGHVPMCLALL